MAFIEPMHRNKPNITYLLTRGSPELQWPVMTNPGLQPGKHGPVAVAVGGARAWVGAEAGTLVHGAGMACAC